MKVLLIGSGGREHALAWKIAASKKVTHFFAAPGNPGVAQYAQLVDMSEMDFPAIEAFVKREKIDLVIIGPEDPLALGLADRLTALGAKVFGPNKAAARMEADKWFAKEMMRHQAVPTAEARVFTNPWAAEEYVQMRSSPLVIKATGLAKGKGVTLCYRTEDAMEAIDKIMKQKAFGDAGNQIVIEELLSGPECSILCFVDRKSIYIMETAQDHKPVDDGDTGAMTGGMGAYSPTPVVTEKLMDAIQRDILVPIVGGLAREEIEYKGVLYAGLMLTAAGPKVLEFNCRFGDPETQPLMARLQTDIIDIMLAVIDGTLDEVELKWDPRPAICVVAASGGYPDEYTKGAVITGIEEADKLPDVKVFHSGTAMKDGQLVTAGGRVLGVTAVGKTVKEAQKRAYEAMKLIHFDGMHYRTDIGHWAIK